MAFSLSNNIAPLVFSSTFAELTFETDLVSVRFLLQDNSKEKSISDQAELGAIKGTTIVALIAVLMLK